MSSWGNVFSNVYKHIHETETWTCSYLRCPTGWVQSSACRFQNWPCSSQTQWGHNSAGTKTQCNVKHKTRCSHSIHALDIHAYNMEGRICARHCYRHRIQGLCVLMMHLTLIMLLKRFSPLGNSPWRTREATPSSRTGCLPPPRSYTSHSD